MKKEEVYRAIDALTEQCASEMSFNIKASYHQRFELEGNEKRHDMVNAIKREAEAFLPPNCRYEIISSFPSDLLPGGIHMAWRYEPEFDEGIWKADHELRAHIIYGGYLMKAVTPA